MSRVLDEAFERELYFVLQRGRSFHDSFPQSAHLNERSEYGSGMQAQRTVVALATSWPSRLNRIASTVSVAHE